MENVMVKVAAEQTYLPGFFGNPYDSDQNGCQDIDECTHSIFRHNCSLSTCENTFGSFFCRCPSGHQLNITDMSCALETSPEYVRWTEIILGTIVGFLVILLAIIYVQRRMKRRKETELRKQYFEQNGGALLTQRLSVAEPSSFDFKVYTEEFLREATDGYDEKRILGEGGQGVVYKGVLPDNSVVAIKRARLGDDSQVEQFINEVLVLSTINHRNVVKLLGCCLESHVPLLVYEFIMSGTLYERLHGTMSDSFLTWSHRLRIAIEVAGTLAYLHSSASIPIIHRDMKTTNVLLDENLTAKVADFGASRLIPIDQQQLKTLVKGTFGYVDPEYHNTGLLNEKSDTFSFGVVLLELLSGQKPVSFERPPSTRHLVDYFTCAMREGKLNEVIDVKMTNADNHQEIHAASRIALDCTRAIGEERPTMKEVAAELEALRVTATKHEPKETSSIKNLSTLEIEAAP
ncbi:hypothetical protein AALP_AA4G048200 [Arabis alpina]|uniref:Protein kinase domain-containing protein n=1 Tax=Arabis alpina TaxID=50452 RepID=A0A087H173_ARAAL|nr:hypothetical protein AALP_AA4G048200 [Arabis alpina]